MAKAVIAYDKDLPEIPGRRPWEKPTSYLVKDDAAPTGKAAKRMAEVTGVPAHTVHKALGAPNWDKKISAPYVIIDETSMVDLPLAFRILKAARNSNIVFIGDADQLASVGPGSFFRDLITCKLFPTTRLLTNHRQGEGSSIAEVCSSSIIFFLPFLLQFPRSETISDLYVRNT